MQSSNQKKILSNSAKEVFDLVMDIENYPHFLPWCKQSKIISKISDSELTADLVIGFKGFVEKYRSLVTFGKIENDLYFIDVVAIEGPFKTLINKWQFRNLTNNSCEVKFFIEFEFNSLFLEKMIGVIFKKAEEKMINAFEKRAIEIYSNKISHI